MSPMNNRLLRPTQANDPRLIAGLGAWFDASDMSTLSQTSDGTTPVTASDDPVAYFKCKVTGTPLTQIVDANRPLWKAASLVGGKPGLEFDGSNDSLFAVSGDLMNVARNVSGLTIFCVLRSADAVTRAYWHISVGGASDFFRARAAVGYVFGIFAGGRRLDADAFQSITSTYSQSTNYIVRQTHDYNNTLLQVHQNGVLGNSQPAFQTVGSTSDTPSAYVMFGNQFTNDAFTATATPFYGILCEWLIYSRALTPADSLRVERYLSSKYGIAIQ